MYTAVGYQEFLKFLGTTEEKSLKANPISPGKKKELLELLTWLYGSRETKISPVVRSQNPDLNQLREVVDNAAALSNLRATKSLKVSFEISLGDSRRFEDAVYQAQENLKQALGVALKGYNRKDERITLAIKDMVALANELVSTTVEKPRRTR